MEDPRFRPDLFRGTARYYERYRPGYPGVLIEDLKNRVGLPGTGRLIDLGCGTGHISFALHGCFSEVWAVDQEPDMVAACREKVSTTGSDNIRCVRCSAEEFSIPDGSCTLIGIGNAFHRFDRTVVASRCLRWLEPGGHLALLWGGTPWRGPDDWQSATSSLIDTWMTELGVHDRIPAGHGVSRRHRPDVMVLEEVGFDLIGAWDFSEDHWWTTEALIGFVYLTSFLSPPVLGERTHDFEEDLERTLRRYHDGGAVHQRMRFAYELARKPV